MLAGTPMLAGTQSGLDIGDTLASITHHLETALALHPTDRKGRARASGDVQRAEIIAALTRAERAKMRLNAALCDECAE